MDNIYNSIEPEIKEYTLKECHELGRIGPEAEVRAAISYAITEIADAQRQVESLIEIGDCASMLRAQRSRRNGWKLALTHLRERITVLNQQRKANIQPRAKLNLEQIVQVAQALQTVSLKNTNIKSKPSTPVEIDTGTYSRDYTFSDPDPVAAASITNIQRRIANGETLRQIAQKGEVDPNKELLESLSAVRSEPLDTEEL